MRGILIVFWTFICVTFAATTFTTLNKRLVNPGTGIVVAAGSVSADTAVMASQATTQAGTPFKCKDTSADGKTFYCNMIPAPEAYVDAQLVIFVPNANCVAGPSTLGIGALGLKRIVKANGTSDLAAGDCTKGLPMLLFFVQALDSGAGAFLSSK